MWSKSVFVLQEHSVALWSPQRFTTCGEAKEGLELPGELASPRPTTFTSIVPAQRGGLSPPVPTVSAVSVGVCRHTVQQAVHSAAKEPEVKEAAVKDSVGSLITDDKTRDASYDSCKRRAMMFARCTILTDFANGWHEVGELMTFVVLAANALWTGLEMELNDATVIQEAHPAIIVIENLFVLFFSFELAVRFGAFRRTPLALWMWCGRAGSWKTR
eukprot:g24478.t1